MFDAFVPADVIQIGELAIVKGCDLGEKIVFMRWPLLMPVKA